MDKLMYEGLANIGDTIRGYDFTPDPIDRDWETH